MKRFVLLLSFVTFMAQEADTKKVPDPIALRIRAAQVDQLRTNQDLIKLQAQYNQLSAPLIAKIQADDVVLDELKKEALVALKLDPNKFNLDLEKMEGVVKPAPPTPPAKKEDKK